MKWYYKLIIAFILSVAYWTIDFPHLRLDYYPIEQSLLGALITWLPIFGGLYVLGYLFNFMLDIEEPKKESQ